jgi:hypothetical protein
MHSACICLPLKFSARLPPGATETTVPFLLLVAPGDRQPDVCSRRAPDLVQPCYCAPTALPMQVGRKQRDVNTDTPHLLFRVFLWLHRDVTCLLDLSVGLDLRASHRSKATR